MFDVGFWELALIGVVALLIVGPERLPGVVRTAGRWLGKARRIVREAKADLEREMKAHDIEALHDLKRDAKSAGAAFQSAARDLDADAATPGAALRDTFKDAAPAGDAAAAADTTVATDAAAATDATAATPAAPATAPAGDFYIYQHRGRAVLHAAHCTYCNHGRGRGGRAAGMFWQGPYATRAAAERAQGAMTAAVKKTCACVGRPATATVAETPAATVAADATVDSNAPTATTAEATPPPRPATAESTPQTP